MTPSWKAFEQLCSATPVFPLSLTIGTYLAGIAVQRRTRWALANPVLLSILMIAFTLRALHMPYATYFSGAQLLHFLLGPATVALAIPLVSAIEHIRRSLWPMLLAILAGSVTSMVSGYVLVRAFGGSQVLALSMLPKSLTTPIALDIAQGIGAIPSLVAVLAILAGILVAVSINGVLRWIRVSDPNAIGLAAGTAGSGVGASRVIDQHPLSAAFAAVAIGLNGLITAALAPFFATLLKRW